MKFEKKYFYQMVPEWRSSYLNYKLLVQQIRFIKKAALDVASAHSRIRLITGSTEGNVNITIENLAVERLFWSKLGEEVEKVETFYETQFYKMVLHFHILIIHMIRMGIMDKYEPFIRSGTTQLERELESFQDSLGMRIILRPTEQEPLPMEGNFLIPLTAESTPEEVLVEISKMQKSTASISEPVEFFSSDEDILWGSDEDKRDYAAEKNLKLNRELPDTLPNWEQEEDWIDGLEEPWIEASDSNYNYHNSSDDSGYQGYDSDDTPRNENNEPFSSNNAANYNNNGNNNNNNNNNNDNNNNNTIPNSKYNTEVNNFFDSNYGNNTIRSIIGSKLPKFKIPSNISEEQKMELLESRKILSDELEMELRIDQDELLKYAKSKSSHLQSDKNNEYFKKHINNYFQNINPIDPNQKNQFDIRNLCNNKDKFKIHIPASSKTPLNNQTSRDDFNKNPIYSNKKIDFDAENHHFRDYNTVPLAIQKFPSTGTEIRSPVSFNCSLDPPTSVNFSPIQGHNTNFNNDLLFDLDKKLKYKKTDGQEVSQMEVLQRAWMGVYKTLDLLKKYNNLNKEALAKILTKHEKSVRRGTKHRFRDNLNYKNYSFLSNKAINFLMNETENVYARVFANGQRTLAIKDLKVHNEVKKNGLATFRFGFFLGISIIWLLMICFICATTKSETLIKLQPGLIVFRLVGLTTLLLWSWGLLTYTWKTYQVNFPFIFGFEPSQSTSYQYVFDAAAGFTLILTSSILIFIGIGLQHYRYGFSIPLFEWLKKIPVPIIPLFVFILNLILLLYSQIKDGWWVAISLYRFITSPYFPVVYRDFYVAEFTLSSVIIIYDLKFTLCYHFSYAFKNLSSDCLYSHTWSLSILAILPSLFRSLQCFRRWRDMKSSHHKWNIFKYLNALLVSILSLLANIEKSGNFFLSLWIIALIALTCFSSYWDIRNDWMLGYRKVKYRWLRSQLLYPPAWYYFCIVLTPLGRFLWGLTLSPDIILSTSNPEALMTCLGIFVTFHRTIWNIIRLETEQIENADRYRAVEDIVFPLDENTDQV